MNAQKQGPFTDVPFDGPNERAMDRLHRAGIIVGYPEPRKERREVPPSAPTPDSSSLLRRAQKVPMPASWASYRRHFWLSDNELLFLRHLPRHKNGEYAICRLDLRTRREETLVNLTQLFNQTRGIRWEQSVSPDGKWLLWIDMDEGKATVAHLTGKRHFSWSLSNISDPIFWTPDSQAIVSTELSQSYGHRARLRYLYRSHDPKPFRFSPAGQVPVDNISTIHVTSAERILVVPWYDPKKAIRQTTVFETSLQRATPVWRRSRIAFPPNTFVQEICFSPDGTHIAWSLAFGPKGRAGVEPLWISRSDGSGMRSLGEITLPADQCLDLGRLSWTPRGRHLSFIFQDAVWRVILSDDRT